MNSEQIQGLIRALILGLPAIVGTGVISSGQANQLAAVLPPAVMTVATVLVGWWSTHSHSAPALVAAVNSNIVPGVKVVSEASASPAVQVTSAGEIKPAVPPPTK
jgi:hypothetical protein